MKLTNAQRKNIYRRDGYRCALCDSTRYLQIHHYIRRGQGGSNSPHNLITLCSACHAEVHGVRMYEHDITVEEMEQMIVEYLADMYAPRWNPYEPGSEE